jgi:hypothetical protein
VREANRVVPLHDAELGRNVVQVHANRAVSSRNLAEKVSRTLAASYFPL